MMHDHHIASLDRRMTIESRKGSSSQRSSWFFVVAGWLFLILGAGVGALIGSESDATAGVIALVGMGLGCLLTAIVLMLEDLHRNRSGP
ncbi:hypothetical protein SAMN05216276_10846 [Streptosporangium subroseum]|uniref:Uncharacterized protein n=1 Tax=Streptosporangium subroseum TaxID=106412 RepID=A0A239P2Y1_9ACTN|nr:hypothetical protein SAMN05216276_10846 [Streptosporangium subroseum]